MTLYVTAPTNWMEARRQMLRRMLASERDEQCDCSLTFPVDIITNDDEYTLQALLPGVKSEDVEIQFNDGVLTIEGEYKSTGNEETRYVLSEIPEGKFSRSFELRDPVDVDNIQASMANGVLTLHIPKSPEAKPRTIKINSN